MRPKVTNLTTARLKRAEAAYEVLEGTDIDLLELAIQARARPKPELRSSISFETALLEFLREKEQCVSPLQLKNYRGVVTRLGNFVGAKNKLSDMRTADILAWLQSCSFEKKKTWNTARDDVSAFFKWCVAKPRSWISENPVEAVFRHKRRDVINGQPERLTIKACRELMLNIEQEHPTWTIFFALTLFAGIRPQGEMSKLAKCIRRDGADRYVRNGFLHLSPEITKDRRPRQTPIPDNLSVWLGATLPTPKEIFPGRKAEYLAIRARFAIPHDGLRHTAISAYVAKCGSLAKAAVEFGNSERVIRDSYLNTMSEGEAREFYQIFPRSGGAQQRTPEAAA